MKKILLLFCFLSFAWNVKSTAQIPNWNFETILSDSTLSNWGNITLLAIMIDSTGSQLVDSIIFDGPFCGASSDAHTGNFALEMRNAFDFTYNYSIPGWASADTDSVYSAWGSLEFLPITDRPDEFNFFYKFLSVGSDSARAVVTFYDGMMNTIGEASIVFDVATSAYSYVSVPVSYISSDQVEYYSMNFANYYTLAEIPIGAHFGTRLLIDDVTFSFPSGVDDQINSSDVVIYPNPVSSHISVKNVEVSEYKLFNIEGRMMQSGKFNSGEKIILERKIANGTYILEINVRGVLLSKKFVVDQGQQ